MKSKCPWRNKIEYRQQEMAQQNGTNIIRLVDVDGQRILVGRVERNLGDLGERSTMLLNVANLPRRNSIITPEERKGTRADLLGEADEGRL